jgi:hypothetical protein
MNRTIVSVKPQPNQWNGPKGTVYFVGGNFDDGSQWSIGAQTPEKADELIATFEALIGKPLEGWDVQPKMNKQTGQQDSYNGILKWEIKKPFGGGNGFRGGGGGGSGGGKTWTESYAQSKECKETEQRSIQRSVALEKAHQYHVAFAGLTNDPVTPQAILATAEIYADWLGKQPDTSQEYRTWVTWMESKVKVKFFTSKEDAWKNAMTYANEMGYDHLRLKTCTDHSIFRKIQDKLEAPSHPRNGNVQQPNAYQRQPAYYAPEDDSLPF